ncbi:hypothetical protein RRG08_054040 [Elysia crispata]|uniref:Uncharacterized protein n=1 Tax=Elysia crispata TaxID=231223 RepID=A0AAE0ZAV4_9GAST|nr:hypothetical protein RRG08_054040 [Elysia crispata]
MPGFPPSRESRISPVRMSLRQIMTQDALIISFTPVPGLALQVLHSLNNVYKVHAETREDEKRRSRSWDGPLAISVDSSPWRKNSSTHRSDVGFSYLLMASYSISPVLTPGSVYAIHPVNQMVINAATFLTGLEFALSSSKNDVGGRYLMLSNVLLWTLCGYSREERVRPTESLQNHHCSPSTHPWLVAISKYPNMWEEILGFPPVLGGDGLVERLVRSRCGPVLEVKALRRKLCVCDVSNDAPTHDDASTLCFDVRPWSPDKGLKYVSLESPPLLYLVSLEESTSSEKCERQGEKQPKHVSHGDHARKRNGTQRVWARLQYTLLQFSNQLYEMAVCCVDRIKIQVWQVEACSLLGQVYNLLPLLLIFPVYQRPSPCTALYRSAWKLLYQIGLALWPIGASDRGD